jgi:aminopeptidase N
MREDTFVAERVHDIVAACDVALDKYVGASGAVRIELYAPPGYALGARRQLQLVAAGLGYFTEAYGAYPYPQLTVVIPPRGADGAAGMEYPTFFMSGGPWWALPSWLPDAGHDVVAAHELAHQWFSGMIATNEVEIPMLDEGLAEWSSLDFLRAYSRTKNTWLDPFPMLEATFLFRGHPVPSSLQPAYEYGYDTLQRAIYLRPARVLEQIERKYGSAKLRAGMRRYALAGRFQHPKIEDFYAAFDAVFGAGWSARELAPALEGKTDFADSGEVRPAATRFFPDVWFAIQALLHALGP